MYTRENLLHDVHKSTKVRPGSDKYKDEVMTVLLNLHKNMAQDAVVDLSTALVEEKEFDELKFKTNPEVKKLVDLFCKQLGPNQWWKKSNYQFRTATYKYTAIATATTTAIRAA